MPSSSSKKYKIYGEYIDIECTKVRMKVVYESHPFENLTIVGKITSNFLKGKCFDGKRPSLEWEIELYRSI